MEREQNQFWAIFIWECAGCDRPEPKRCNHKIELSVMTMATVSKVVLDSVFDSGRQN